MQGPDLPLIPKPINVGPPTPFDSQLNYIIWAEEAFSTLCSTFDLMTSFDEAPGYIMLRGAGSYFKRDEFELKYTFKSENS